MRVNCSAGSFKTLPNLRRSNDTNMSCSPERKSSYRRHFEGNSVATSVATSVNRIRVSSPSPTRRSARSASYSLRAASTGRRSTSDKSRMNSGSMEALCFGMSMGLGPKLDLDAATAENQAFMTTRTGERKEMVALNDRLAVYIEKVRSLETKNKLLEDDIHALRSRFLQPSGLRQLYETQLKDLTRVAEQMRVRRDQALGSKEAMAGQLDALKARYDQALEARRKTELQIEAFRPDVDKATSTRISLEKHLENLELELTFLQRVHKEEIEVLLEQLYSSASKVDLTFGLPDLSSALKQIQSQYDSIAAKNLQEMDTWYKTKFVDLNNASTKHIQSLQSLREESAGCKKDIGNKERELEALQTRNEYLEAVLRDAVVRFRKKEEDLQVRIAGLKLDLQVTKEKIALLLRDYQDLLNVKMALEIEITTYRKLIEGEDNRLSAMVHVMSLRGGGGGVAVASGSTAANGCPATPSGPPPPAHSDAGGKRGAGAAAPGANDATVEESRT
ncbi:notochord granular surface isoform X1 [Gadus chalcogrammus]|uniref:notochord granular surface isoform X1 n=2 Tax=Gadus chalcogrammus TaxID=1042646 RepID=UPI0024C4D1CB|nr:notochord granular surface isoform X1 [Gadus chalcogrammus]